MKQSLTALPPKPQVPPQAPQGAATASAPAGKGLDPNLFVNGATAPSVPSLAPAPIQDEEPTQRLSIDMPLSLHVLIKSGCAMRRTKIKEEVLALLEAHYRPKQ
jgi:hypothetical protein